MSCLISIPGPRYHVYVMYKRCSCMHCASCSIIIVPVDHTHAHAIASLPVNVFQQQNFLPGSLVAVEEKSPSLC